MFVALRDAIDRLSGLSSNQDLAEAFGLFERLRARLSAAVGEFDRAGLWELDGAISMVAWLTTHDGMNRPAAARFVSVASRLRSLPVTRAAWEAGVLSGDQVHAIVSALDPRVIDRFADAEPWFVPTVAGLSVRDTGYVARTWNARAIAALDDPAPTVETNHCHLSQTLDGTWVLDARLDGDAGKVVDTAIREATTTDDPTNGDETRTAAQRRADALVDVCHFYLDHHEQPGGRRNRPHLNLVISWQELQAGAPGHHVAGDPIDTATILAYSCDAEIHRLLTDGASTILDYGIATRTVPKGLFNALVLRDQHCRYPGCDRPPDWCDAHHIKHYSNGGPTALINLALLCKRHHHKCHQPGWRLHLDPDATLTITTPNGRTLTSRPSGHQLVMRC
jgi:Domain of unknown function (DUF222)